MATKTRDELWLDLVTTKENFENDPNEQTLQAFVEACNAAR
jgi:hypothetical protein